MKRAVTLPWNSGRTRRSIAERFWPKVDKTGDCWLWTASRIHNGYGKIGSGGDRGSTLLAHRVSWELANERPVPAGMVVCHSCDVKLCVRPDHLFVGTQLENVRDMDVKARRVSTPHAGEANGSSKLSVVAVLAIRARRAAGETTNAIARDFGIAPTCVSAIALRQAWRHV